MKRQRAHVHNMNICIYCFHLDYNSRYNNKEMSRTYHLIEALHTPKFQPVNTIVGLWTCPTCDVKIVLRINSRSSAV